MKLTSLSLSLLFPRGGGEYTAHGNNFKKGVPHLFESWYNNRNAVSAVSHRLYRPFGAAGKSSARRTADGAGYHITPRACSNRPNVAMLLKAGFGLVHAKTWIKPHAKAKF
nr:hypothetical protein [Pseudoflavonifractor sp. BIOML-A3]